MTCTPHNPPPNYFTAVLQAMPRPPNRQSRSSASSSSSCPGSRGVTRSTGSDSAGACAAAKSEAEAPCATVEGVRRSCDCRSVFRNGSWNVSCSRRTCVREFEFRFLNLYRSCICFAAALWQLASPGIQGSFWFQPKEPPGCFYFKKVLRFSKHKSLMWSIANNRIQIQQKHISPLVRKHSR